MHLGMVMSEGSFTIPSHCLIPFGGRSAQLAHFVPKSGRETANIRTQLLVYLEDRCGVSVNWQSC